MDDAALSGFILSDIVTRIYRRSSYVFYNGEIVLLKFVGSSLCICTHGVCQKVINLRAASELLKLDGDDRSSFIVGGVVFDCSHPSERDEWYGSLLGVCSG